jgi:hypothetical protein
MTVQTFRHAPLSTTVLWLFLFSSTPGQPNGQPADSFPSLPLMINSPGRPADRLITKANGMQARAIR